MRFTRGNVPVKAFSIDGIFFNPFASFGNLFVGIISFILNLFNFGQN